MSAYVEVAAGTACTTQASGRAMTYPEQDVLKVTSRTEDTVTCSGLVFNIADVTVIGLAYS